LSIKTVSKVQHDSTPEGLKLFVKWTEGRELLRNSAKFEGRKDWEPASTVGTRVVFDSAWDEYCVYVYINEKRYYPSDYYTSDKADALNTAKALRASLNWGVKPTSPEVKVAAKSSSKKKTTKKVKVTPKVAKKSKAKVKAKVKVKASPKVKKARKTSKAKASPKVIKSSPKEKTSDELMAMIEASISHYVAKQAKLI